MGCQVSPDVVMSSSILYLSVIAGTIIISDCINKVSFLYNNDFFDLIKTSRMRIGALDCFEIVALKPARTSRLVVLTMGCVAYV